MTVCRGWSLVKEAVDHIDIIAMRCKRWNCPDCSPWRRKKLIAQVMDGKPNSFLTLTVNPAVGEDAEQRCDLLIHAYQVLMKRIRRRPGCEDVAAMYTLEETKRGEPHMHVMLRAPFIPQWWIKEVMAELIGAPVVWIEYVPDAGRAGAYCAKYVSKRPKQFRLHKRYAFTRNYAVAWQTARALEARDGLKWRIVRQTIAEYVKTIDYYAWTWAWTKDGARLCRRC